jgi:hypothetical protein
VIDEARTGNRVTHAGGLERSIALDEELKIAMHIVRQVEVIIQLTFVHIDESSGLVRVLEGIRHVADLEITQVIVEV